MFFASDNAAPCPPEVMAALSAVNQGFAMPYGNDAHTARAVQVIRDLFEAPEAAVYFVSTGTVANCLSLATVSPLWGAVFCHTNAHVQEDECGAPEVFTGGKLLLVPGEHGRMCPEALDKAIRGQKPGVVHSVQPGAVTLTNITEGGTLYTVEQTRAIAAVAKAHGLPLHLDGARFANAVAASGATPAELTWKAGVDIVSFGGTKGGLMGAEAVIFFNPEKAFEFELRRKRSGHLFSKTRYLAAQFEGWIAQGQWLTHAAHANAMAARLAEGLAKIPGVTVAPEAAANILFVKLPEEKVEKLREAGAVFYLRGDDYARLVTSWATTEDDCDRFIALAAA